MALGWRWVRLVVPPPVEGVGCTVHPLKTAKRLTPESPTFGAGGACGWACGWAWCWVWSWVKVAFGLELKLGLERSKVTLIIIIIIIIILIGETFEKRWVFLQAQPQRRFLVRRSWLSPDWMLLFWRGLCEWFSCCETLVTNMQQQLCSLLTG